MKAKQKAIFVFMLLLLIASGFVRDFFMLNINHVLMHLKKNMVNFSQPSFYFLEAWTINEIMILKWVLTIVFFFYFWLISWGVLKSYFVSSPGKSVRAISFVYMALIGLAGFLFVIGHLTGIDRSMYHIVRTLTGLTHSFIPAMLVFLYLKYFPES